MRDATTNRGGWRQRWAGQENERRRRRYQDTATAWQRQDSALRQMRATAASFAGVQDVAGDILGQLPAEEFPHFTEMVVHHALRPGYSYADEFEVGLNLILDALAGLRHQT